MSVKFISHKKEVLSHIEENIDRALEICGGTAERHAKGNLTRNHSVITNRLRGSINHRKFNKTTEIIGTEVEYAPYVELGHHQEPGRYVPAIKKRLVASWVKPKPYLRPAIEDHADEYRQIIKRELSK